MNFAFSEEQEAFSVEIRRFVEERWPVAEVRRLMDAKEGFDRGIWKQMAQELGLQGVAIAEEHGGQGFGFLELGLILQEFGRELAGGPFFATTCLGAPAIQLMASEAQRAEWLPQIASGELIATLAAGTGEVEATPDGDRFRLSGRKRFVVDGQNADLILVSARASGELGLFAVRGDAARLDVHPLSTLDPTRKLADLSLDGVLAERVGEGDASASIERCLDIGAIGLAAEGLGATARCLDDAVAYAKERMQFARPIGSFQAIKHKTAEMLLELELARSVAYWSWWAVDDADTDLAEAASMAKSLVGDAFLRGSREFIQILGGMGYTWEADAHLFYKRARSSEAILGSPSAHRQRLADGMGIPSRP